jgi:hypothetical protein
MKAKQAVIKMQKKIIIMQNRKGLITGKYTLCGWFRITYQWFSFLLVL